MSNANACNEVVREFCKWVHTQRPNLVKDYKAFVAQHNALNHRTLFSAYFVPLMRDYAKSKGFGRAPGVASSLAPHVASHPLFGSTLNDFIFERVEEMIK